MDKETLIKLAQPAATSLLAISIISFPFIANAERITGFGPGMAVEVYHTNSCAD